MPRDVELALPSHLPPSRALAIAREVAGLSAYGSPRFQPEATLAQAREPAGTPRLVIRAFPARPALARALESDILLMLFEAFASEGSAEGAARA